MQSTIAPYLLSTYQMINCAFPDGIESETYLPLLVLLYDQMSNRSLAGVVAEYTGEDYYVVLNDVYRVCTYVPEPEAIAKVRRRLYACGYEKWLEED